MKLKLAVCDDFADLRELIAQILAYYPQREQLEIHYYATGEALLADQITFDLVLISPEQGQTTAGSFALVKQLSEQSKIVLMSDNSEEAIQRIMSRYDFEVFGYIHKINWVLEIPAMLDKFLAWQKNSEQAENRPLFERQTEPKSINAVYQKNIRPEEVRYLRKSHFGGQITLGAIFGTYTFKGNFQKASAHLEGLSFYKSAHKRFVVNLDYVALFKNSKGGMLRILGEDKKPVCWQLSRKEYAAVKDAIGRLCLDDNAAQSRLSKS